MKATKKSDEIEMKVTERIKTFEDACKELGENHPFVLQYNTLRDAGANGIDCPDISAYLKLRIICAALNEGWEPKFTNDEYRCYPWFRLYTQEDIDRMDEEERKNLVLWGGDAVDGATCGLASAVSNRAWSHSLADFGSRHALKTRELAIYCGKQFIDLWCDFYILRK